MIVAKTIKEVRRQIDAARSAGKTIALVPTMGALHAGHLSLVDAAAEACDFVAVSIFVNPTQFGPGEDFQNYPRTLDADLSACRDHKVDLVFSPPAEEMYGRGGLTTVIAGRLSETLCGRSRPGHFTGVCTVVAKLFNIFLPDKAFFGAKDYQQAIILRRMVEDLNFPVEVVICPTIREPDGLAMSSRNRYLTPDQRSQAAALYGALQLTKRLIEQTHPPAAEVREAIKQHLSSAAKDGQVDYIQIVDPDELSDVESTDRPVLIALAVKIGRARLIDNMLVDY